MRQRTTALLGALAIIALMVLAYHSLPPRPFAADDFQWLLGARQLSFGDMLRSAFDFNQSHFFRPMVWLLFWTQEKLFGIDPRGYHAVSLALHLANAALVGLLAWRLGTSATVAVIAAAIVALHPAPFEAVVWVSAQSELLAALWLLLMLHAWLGRRVFLASLLLTLALLTKESAIIGLPLLFLIDIMLNKQLIVSRQRWFTYLLPMLLTLAYLALQLRIERDNYLVERGGYGFGPQLLLNPLRSVGLLVAPLPGTEHADAAWLPFIGALAVLGVVAWLVIHWRSITPSGNRRAVIALAALAVTLLPTAPFSSPPDSRYLYLPVIAGALLLAALLERREQTTLRQQVVQRRALLAISVALIALFAAESQAREARFATATGTDGSLFAVAAARCATLPTDRVIIMGAPIAEVHARAILALACGESITPIFADTLEMAEANLERDSLVIGFPNGAAQVIREM